MKLLVLAGGFHEAMPYEELRKLGMDINKKDGRVVVGEAESTERLKETGYSHLVLEFLGSFSTDESLPFDPSEHIEGKFAARFKKLDFSGGFEEKKQEILEEMGSDIKTVDLEDPDTTFYFLMKGERIYAGKLIYRVDPTEFTKRKPALKPYSRPVSLPPREARCWVNLSTIKEGESLLDPFCGTGAILVEGGLVGCEVYGSDLENEMVDGSKINLDHYGLEGTVKKCRSQDLKKCWGRKFDAVVTDPPYGRSAKVGGEKIKKLYRKSLSEIEKVMKEGGSCVIGAPEKIQLCEILEDMDSSLVVSGRFKEKVHGDLFREIFVLAKNDL